MEYELKLRITSRPDLSELEYLGTVIEEDVYYDHPCRSFAQSDEALRLRRISGDLNKLVLTYKGPRLPGKVKIREELEVELDSLETMDKILKRLGFKPVARIRKRREAYRYKDVIVTIDEVEGLGLFMEIEGPDEESVLKALRELKLEGTLVEKTYLELFLEHHGRALGNHEGEVSEGDEADDAREEKSERFSY